MDDGRKRVGQRLARAGLGDADHVLAHQGHGPPLALDRRGLLEARFDDLLVKVRREVGLGERRDRLGHTGAGHFDFVALVKVADFIGRARRHVRVLLVKVLLELET